MNRFEWSWYQFYGFLGCWIERKGDPDDISISSCDLDNTIMMITDELPLLSCASVKVDSDGQGMCMET